MRNFIKQNPWFMAGLVVTVLISLALVHKLGLWGMYKTINPMPERLRDMTFPIWDKYSFFEHGFLAFLTKEDFHNGIAYSNHSSLYLFFMYFFYKIEMLIPKLPMRVVVAYLEMIFYVVTSAYIAISNLKEKVKFSQGVLILLTIMFLVTMPDFWLTAGKFNVDNPFHLELPLLLLIAYQLAIGETSGVKLWLLLALFCLFAPISGALLGAYLVVSSIKKDSLAKDMFQLGVRVIYISVAIYLQPVVVSKILGFYSANSSWIFRAGLDGDVANFNNVFNAAIKPFYPRPMYLILVPISLLLVQLAIIFADKNNNKDKLLAKGADPKVFFGVLFSHYLITALLWPQSLSIHPYLYDFWLVGPVYVWILLNFASSRTLGNNPRVWIWIMLFFISFNLQQISQANRCFYCFYPSWTPNQYVIKP